MIVIRKAQMEMFAKATLERFIADMAAYVRREMPLHAKALGEPGLDAALRRGIERAKRHGIVIYEDLGKYLVLMLVHGESFDDNPALGWVADILQDGELPTPTAKVERLYQEARARQYRTRIGA